MANFRQTLAKAWNSVKKGAAYVGQGITNAFAAIGNFLGRHWLAVATVLLGILAGAAVAAAVFFIWPAIVASLAAFTLTIPAFIATLIGVATLAPLAFLTGLSLPVAAAIVGGLAVAATLAAGVVLAGVANVLSGIYTGLDNKFNPDAPVNQSTDHTFVDAKTGVVLVVDEKQYKTFEAVNARQAFTIEEMTRALTDEKARLAKGAPTKKEIKDVANVEKKLQELKGKFQQGTIDFRGAVDISGDAILSKYRFHKPVAAPTPSRKVDEPSLNVDGGSSMTNNG